MDEETLLKRRVDDWARLTELSDRADSSLKRMSGDDLIEFVRLYRKASADLAFMSTQTSNAEVIQYLNALVSRAYALLYRTPSRPIGTLVTESFTTAAQTLRKHAWALALSSAIFFGSAVFTFQAMKARPELRSHFVPPQMEDVFSEWKKGKHTQREGGESLGMTAFYAQNNPRVGVMINAVSVATAGTLTTYLLWTNGAVIGALACDMASVGKLGFLLASVSPHGVSEVGGLLVTAAGGFVVAKALINPGRKRRGDALRIAGKDALTLMLTGLVMICIAAPIEGFFSFNPAVPIGFKVAFAVIALIAWTAFFTGYGREKTVNPSERRTIS